MTKASEPDHATNGIAAAPLRALIERIEVIEGTIHDEQEARKEVYEEAKSKGFDAKIMKKIVALRKKAAAARREEAEILRLYCDALGMQGELPL